MLVKELVLHFLSNVIGRVISEVECLWRLTFLHQRLPPPPPACELVKTPLLSQSNNIQSFIAGAYVFFCLIKRAYFI